MSTAAARPARPPRPRRPELAQPEGFEMLDQTHRDVMLQLTRLGELIEHLDRQGVDERARELARSIAGFFNGHARQHHADEEARVFPGLLGSGDAELVGHVRRLQQDHGWLEEDWLELAPPLEAIAKGYNWYDLDMLRHALPVFTELYREHILLEESVVYPAARHRLAALRAGEHQRRS